MKGMYAWSRGGCWIETSGSDCLYDYEGLIFIFVFDYGPELFIVLATLISLVTIFTVMCRGAVRQEQVFYQPSIHQRGLKELLPLLLYPLIYLVLWTTIVATHIDDAAVNIRVQERNSMTPWLVYSIATYILGRTVYTLDLSTTCEQIVKNTICLLHNLSTACSDHHYIVYCSQ